MNSMTEGTPWKKILIFMLPVFAGLLLQQLYNIADTIIVGNFAGEAALASVGATSVMTMAFLALANGFSAGAGILISRDFGAGNHKDLRIQASSSILLMLAMGAAATVLALFISRFMLSVVLGTPQSLVAAADIYFKLYALGLIFQFGYNIVAAILRGVGDSKATLYFLLVASVLNVGLDILFVYNFRMGVVGAAIATDIAQIGSCLAGFIYMAKKYPVFRFGLKEWRWEMPYVINSLKTGFPMALQQFIVSIGFTFILRAVNSYGEAMTASYSVASKIEMLMVLPANALMVTQGTYAGQNIGAGRIDRVKTGVIQTVIISDLISLIIVAVLLLFVGPVIALFGLGPEAAAYCTMHIRFVTICLVIFASYFPILGTFQGTNDAFFAAMVAASALGLRVASAYILKSFPQFDFHMIWWNTAFGWLPGFIITWQHYLRGKWQKKF